MPKHIAIYVRVSSKQQEFKSQEPDLKRWAEDNAEGQTVKWYTDKASGKSMNRPGWNKLEKDFRAGKVSMIVVWSMCRLGRTAAETLALRDELVQRKVDLVMLKSGMMGIDTREGRLVFGLLAQIAEYDNEIRSERIRAGQAVAKANGKKWGGSKAGKRKKVSKTQIRAIKRMKDEGEKVAAIARAVGLSRPTVYDVLRNE